MKTFIHIGLPKALSTTLQRSFFERHLDINFMGVGIGNNIGYKNDRVEFISETLLKYSRRDVYERYKKASKLAIHNALDPNKVNVFSSEHLSIDFTLQGIDPLEKIDRCKDLFGEDSEIILIKRDPEKLTESMWKELVKLGYNQQYDEYMKWLNGFKDRNAYLDIFDQEKLEWLWRSHFKKVHALHFEDLVENPRTNINAELSTILKIDNNDLHIGHHNVSLKWQEAVDLVKKNNEIPRGLGLNSLHPFELHRNRVCLRGQGWDEDEIFNEVKQKRNALKDKYTHT